MTFRRLIPIVALLVVAAAAGRAAACPGCTPQSPTLVSEVAQADLILYGTVKNAQLAPGGFNGTSDIEIDLVIKPHDVVKGKKTITIPRYIGTDPKAKLKHLIFFYVGVDGTLDPYRGEAVPADSKLPDYLQKALAIRAKDTTTRLLFFLDYLEDADSVISTDAYNEFAIADYNELRPVAEKLRDLNKAPMLLKWLRDPNTRPYRYGLYGLMLGHCGTPEDAKALRAVLDDPNRPFSSGLEGLVFGYVMLEPKAGWEYVLGMVKDPKKDFPVRYAGLKVVRFFWDYRPDIISHSQALEAMKLLMTQPDLADLPIEDLRRWQVWELTPLVLGYANKPSHAELPIVYRAILKFAIAAAAADPKNEAAVEFVKAARAKNPRQVSYLEDLIRDEQRPVPVPSPGKTPSPGK
jgi:hypothetical protein